MVAALAPLTDNASAASVPPTKLNVEMRAKKFSSRSVPQLRVTAATYRLLLRLRWIDARRRPVSSCQLLLSPLNGGQVLPLA
jgi:hypothetical protein